MEPVVSSTEIERGIMLVRMQDRLHGNAFSDELITGLLETFSRINTDENCKAVVLTGYDSYFATGGTREGLLSLHSGKGSFADTNLYSLALDCPVPVVSAMQGHGIGGGLVMGLFSDLIVLSRESVYATNFMHYGFTPGMGATCIVPQKLGIALAEEMLFLGRNYRGEELKQRGVSFPVLSRNEVLPHAIEMARSLAEKPRVSLVALKDLLVDPIREALPSTVKKEQAMHAKTFHLDSVKANIEARFRDTP
jgi:polyketide biosynthesis enoyl-CoA hydratase PksI